MMPSSFLGILENGWAVITGHWAILLFLLFSFVTYLAFTIQLLRWLGVEPLDMPGMVSLGLGGGILAMTLVSGIAIMVSFLIGRQIDYPIIFWFSTVGLWVAIFYFRWKFGSTPKWRPKSILTMLGIWFVIFIIRMAFISGLELPLYSDSVAHYMIVEDLLNPYPVFGILCKAQGFACYYHYGFHFLVAWTHAVSKLSISESILVLGQFTQALIPLTLYFPVKAFTKSEAGAWFAVILAAFGWAMPAYATNWGKYPAILSLCILTFVPGVLFLLDRMPKPSRPRKTLGIVIALMGGLVALIIHTRIIVLILIGILALLTMKYSQQLKFTNHPGYSIVLCLSTALVMYHLSGDQVFSQAVEANFAEAIPAILAVTLLLPAALVHHRQATNAVLLSTLLLCLVPLMPFPEFLQQDRYATLLDRPFVQMVLFVPLSLLGGIGLAGTHKWLMSQNNKGRYRALRISVIPALYGLIMMGSFLIFDYAPNPECRLVSRNDLAAFEWINANLPEEAKFLTPVSDTPGLYLGVDGSAWLTALTDRSTVKWVSTRDLLSVEGVSELCEAGAGYVYSGDSDWSFKSETLELKPDWYEKVFEAEGVRIFKVRLCAVQE